MENQSEGLKGHANQFKKGSKELANIMRWRNIKLWIIFCCFLLAVIIYLALPFIKEATKKDDSDDSEDDEGERNFRGRIL